MRAQFFGPSASTARTTQRLLEEFPSQFRSLPMDIRDTDGVMRVIGEHAKDLELVVHAAAQPSHDWAASDAQTDFSVNANGTMNLLEAVRHRKPEATFIFMSTNKVYGDHPNRLPLYETETRLELPEDHEYHNLHRWPSARAMKRIRARVKALTDRRRRAGMKDVRDVIAALNPVLRGWGNYFRTGNAAVKFVQLDRYVAWRLKRLLIKRKGRNLRAGEAAAWTPDWLWGLGLHRLMGTDPLPRDRVSDARKIIGKPCAGKPRVRQFDAYLGRS